MWDRVGVNRGFVFCAFAVLLMLSALFTACGRSDSQEPRGEPIGNTVHPAEPNASAAASAENVTTLTFTLPSDVFPMDVVVAAADGVTLGPRARIIEGHVVNMGSAEISTGIDAAFQDTRTTSVGSVVVHGSTDPKAWIEGPIRTAGTVIQLSKAQVTGPLSERSAIAAEPYRREVSFPPAGPDRTVKFGTQVTLGPGAYGRIDVFGTLTLEPGVYYLTSLDLHNHSKLVLRNAAEPVHIHLKESLDFDGDVEEQASGASAGNLMVTQWSDRALFIGAPWRGTLLAPLAKISLQGLSGTQEHRGAFFGREIAIAPGATVRYRPFPSYIIGKTGVSTSTPCTNEPVSVTVHALPVSSSHNTAPVLVSINGNATLLENGVAERHIQFFGSGPRKITVTAQQGGMAEVRTIDVGVRACPIKYPRVVATSTLAPYEVEFTVTNAAELTGSGRTFAWDFGDGQRAETPLPYIRHSYAHRLDASTPELHFEAVLTLRRDGQPDSVVKKTVVMPNLYALGAARGFAGPPVTTSGRLTVDASDDAGFTGSFSFKNLEPNPLNFSERRIQKHFCDPDRDPVVAGPEAIAIGVAGGETYSETIKLHRKEYRGDVCGVSVYMFGRTLDNLPAIVSAHFDTPARPLPTRPVSQPSVRDLLNQITRDGLVADPNTVTTEDLRRLKAEGRITDVPDLGDQLDGVLMATPDDLLGQPCEPDAISEFPTLTCQATEDWEVTAPLVRNALKGDLIIVAACETIGGLLRKVSPRQYYSHEGIFTQNYYALAESTIAAGRLLASVEGIGDKINGSFLKYGWPGGLRQTVTTAFSQLRQRDPENKLQVIETFRPDAVRCSDDALASPPLVIRPPAAQEANVRAALKAAADFAFTSETHYRFFGFSQANIAFDGDRNFNGGNYRAPGSGEPATVSTTFLWHALRSNDVPLELPELETLLREYFQAPGEHDESILGAEKPQEAYKGEKDGLYFYSVAERKAGAEFIYNSTYDAIEIVQDQAAYDVLGWSAEVTGPMLLLLTQLDPAAAEGQRVKIANQFTNCFGYDLCGASDDVACPCTTHMDENGEQVEECPPGMSSQQRAACDPSYVREHPGPGTAVSPDNFLFWDAPHYGYWDFASYRSGVFRRKHSWAPRDGTGACGGTVRLEDGTPVEDARVILQNSSTSSAADGTFLFSAVEAGQYEIRAEKEINGVLHWDAALATVPANDQCAPQELVLTIDGPFADMKPVQVVERRVTLRGELHLHDDENFPFDDEPAHFPINTECVVSPANRQVKLLAGDLTGNSNPCAGDEVRGAVEVTCLLDPLDLTNQRVIVTASVAIVEGTDCSGSGNIFDDPEGAVASFGPEPLAAGESRGTNPVARVEGGDFGSLILTITNNAGDTIVINPIKEENRRKVVFDGSIHLVDDEWAASDETKDVSFFAECFVDPLDTKHEITWSDCVGGELRAELHIECSLDSADATKVSVSTTATMFEETTCLNNDQDGQVLRFTPPLDACENGCSTTWLNSPESGEDLVLKNTDEGGDKVTFHISMRNERQSTH